MAPHTARAHGNLQIVAPHAIDLQAHPPALQLAAVHRNLLRRCAGA